MDQQLQLIETPPEWHIDELTREIGRRGLARARAELQAHQDSTSDPPAVASPITVRTSDKQAHQDFPSDLPTRRAA